MAFKSDLIRWMYIEYLVHSWLGLIGRESGANRSGKKRAWHNLYVGHTHLYIRPGRVLRGRGGLEGKKTCACINVMGGRFLGLVSHFNNTKVSPEGVAKSAYMLRHATPPDYSRIFCRLLRRYLLVFSVFFWQKAERASVIRSEKKFCETPAVQRSCYLFFGEFL